MGSVSRYTANMLNLSFLEPVKELLDQPEVADKVEELGRLFFSSDSVTINLLPAILIGLGSLLFLLPLLGIPVLDLLFGAMTGSSAGGYSAAAYGGDTYNAPTGGYSSSYSARSGESVDLTPEQSALYPELSEIRGQIESLQASEKNLREQIYFNTATEDAGSRIVNQLY